MTEPENKKTATPTETTTLEVPPELVENLVATLLGSLAPYGLTAEATSPEKGPPDIVVKDKNDGVVWLLELKPPPAAERLAKLKQRLAAA
jgi:hypothetical protein